MYLAVQWNHRKRERHSGDMWWLCRHLHLQQHRPLIWQDIIATLRRRLSRLRPRQVLHANAARCIHRGIGHDRRRVCSICPEGKQWRGIQVLRCRVRLRVLRWQHAHAVGQDTDGNVGSPQQFVQHEVLGSGLPGMWGRWFALLVPQSELHGRLGSSLEHRQLPCPGLPDGFQSWTGPAVSGCHLLLFRRHDGGHLCHVLPNEGLSVCRVSSPCQTP